MEKGNSLIFDTTKINLFVKKDADESMNSNSLRSLNSSCDEKKEDFSIQDTMPINKK